MSEQLVCHRLRFANTLAAIGLRCWALSAVLLPIAVCGPNLSHCRGVESPPRRQVNLDFEWRFSLSDDFRYHDAEFDDSTWRRVDVPHDWSIEGEYHQGHPTGGKAGYLPSGIGWYRKEFDVSREWLDRRVVVAFDSVYMNSEVWINGHALGKRPNGYISFDYELTEYLRAGRNVLAVRVDNHLEPSARWYHGCGILGHVALRVTDRLHIRADSLFVTTPEVDKQQATVSVELAVGNDTANTKSAKVEQIILAPDGRQVAKSSPSSVAVSSKDSAHVQQEIVVKDPSLWSPQSPHLYALVTNVYHGEALIDQTNVPFGIRKIEFTADHGLVLNGKPTKLKGVCEHADGGPVGAALYGKVLERRLKLLKQMGCNAIRTAHNPRIPEFYDQCDRMGFLLMNEIFDGWHKKAEWDYGRQAFKEWWQRDVEAWVRRDRNHPSVAIWSIGNETGHHDEHRITELIHRHDPTRPTTGGTIIKGVDVVGFNGPGEARGRLEKWKAENPDKPVVLTEAPHTQQTRGYYKTLTWWRDQRRENQRNPFPPYATTEAFPWGKNQYRSSYDNATVRITARASLKRTMETPWIAGEFRWTGFDYLGENWVAGGWPARMSNFGILDLCGFPKDHYYLYQSQWSSEPMVHLLPHWTWPKLDSGTTIPVVAYSNQEEVELLLNGRSLGRQRRGELLDFVWDVPYEPGQLTAIAYYEGRPMTQCIHVTAGKPVAISLDSDNVSLAADRRDIAHVAISTVDRHGNEVPTADNQVHFHVDGPVRCLGFENGDPLDLTSHRLHHRRLFYGKALGILQATQEEGPIVLTAAGALGERVFRENALVAIDVQQIALRGSLPQSDLQVFFTIDGTVPNPQSATRYRQPFRLLEDTTVKVLVSSGDEQLLRFEEHFRRGVPELVTDERYVSHSVDGRNAVDDPFQGPLDGVIVGTWRDESGDRRLRYAVDGKVYEIESAGETAVADWRYDFPDDRFENLNDFGSGSLRWLSTGKVVPMRLLDASLGKLKVSRQSKKTILTRIDNKAK